MQITMQNIMQKRPTLVPLMYLLPAVLLVVAFVYYPVVNNLWLSLFRWSAFSPQDIWTALRDNVAYVVVSLVFQVGGALVLAAILEEAFVRRFRVFFRTVYFLPTVISMTVVGLLFTFLYDPQMGLIDQLLTLTGHASWVRAWLGDERTAIWAIIAMSQWQSIGYIALLFVVAMQRIPRELYEAAAMDGANRIRIFFRITIPLVREMTLLA